MSVQTGDILPKMKLSDTFGKHVDIKGLKKEYILLAFLRYAGCPFCNLSIHRLSVEAPLLADARCDIISFVQSDAEQIKKNIYGRHKIKPPFPIVPDKEMTHYKKFGVKPSFKNAGKFINDIPQWVHSVRDHGFKQGKIDGSLFIAPAIFLVHRTSGKIIYSDHKSDLFEHETFSPIYEKILTFVR